MSKTIIENTQLLERELEKKPEDSDLLVRAGAHYHMLGDYEMAAKMYQKAYGISREDDILIHHLAALGLKLYGADGASERKKVIQGLEEVFRKGVERGVFTERSYSDQLEAMSREPEIPV